MCGPTAELQLSCYQPADMIDSIREEQRETTQTLLKIQGTSIEVLSAMKIDVHTSHGRVALTGPAPDGAAKARAALLASAVEGVSSVDNRLIVK